MEFMIGAGNGVLIGFVDIPAFVIMLGMLSIAGSLAMVASNNTVVFQFGPDHDKLLYLGGGALLFGIANPVIYTIALALLTGLDRKSTRLNSSHANISYAVFCLKKKKKQPHHTLCAAAY